MGNINTRIVCLFIIIPTTTTTSTTIPEIERKKIQIGKKPQYRRNEPTAGLPISLQPTKDSMGIYIYIYSGKENKDRSNLV